MFHKFLGWLCYFGLVAGILYLGWNQPLQYRFLTRQAIWQIEHPTPAPMPVQETQNDPGSLNPAARNFLAPPSR